MEEIKKLLSQYYNKSVLDFDFDYDGVTHIKFEDLSTHHNNIDNILENINYQIKENNGK